MTQALWGVLLLSLAGGTHAAVDRVEARAPQPTSQVTIANSRAAPTQVRADASAKKVQRSKSADPTSENYKAEMAECRSMTGPHRSACEREMHAARAEGLYNNRETKKK